ncbi:hypothetical protein HDE68_004849 [Pedobacter cryoconitis]|uniref:Uncharacterized protein n=1 Tax=Pedobacter cryoconitis TaxID=188932 RepID=A0A7W8ZRL2_9SPHI|nr:hypothetical protein [Pedobacter cryoconitis]
MKSIMDSHEAGFKTIQFLGWKFKKLEKIKNNVDLGAFPYANPFQILSS